MSSPQEHWSARPYPLVATPIADKPLDYKPDHIEAAATTMALAHNIIVRGLNAIHAQARYVTSASDIVSFLNFCRIWHKGITQHHDTEEKHFFPEVEKLAGEPGIMAGNVEQHAVFHDGLEEFASYVAQCLAAGGKGYDGAKLVGIVENFGGALSQHLQDEIPSLMGLRRFGDKMDTLAELIESTAQKSIGKISLVSDVPVVVACHDRTFESGRHHFPPFPMPINFVIRYIFYRVHADWNKFAPADAHSNLKEQQYAVPPAEAAA